MNSSYKNEITGISLHCTLSDSHLLTKVFLNSWGVDAYIEPTINNNRILQKCLMALAQEVPKTLVFTHTGWHVEKGKYYFFHSGGAVGCKNIQVEMEEERLKRFILPADGDEAKYREGLGLSLNILNVAPLNITIPLLSLPYMAPLIEPL